MALFDFMVDANFRNEKAGRVVVFPGDRRNRGYVVRSEAEELKIRSFLRMFYFAHLSILLLGWFLAFDWSRELSFVLGRQYEFLFRMGAGLGIYCLVVGLPYLLLWRSYKNAFLSFVSAQDEVLVSGKSAGQRLVYTRAGLIAAAAAVLMLLGAFFLVRAK
jgi:hypothetical protein